MNRMLLGYSPDFDAFATAPPVVRPPARRSRPVFNNVDTLNMAVELLEVNVKPQLGPVVRRIVRRATESIGRPLDESVAAALSGLLEVAARHTLPQGMAARFAPDTDAKSKGRFFGIELEGLSPEDQEFETAKAFVHFAAEAARQAARVSERLSPSTAAQLAALLSARRHAPGWARLTRHAAAGSTTGPDRPTTDAKSASIF
jgi:hypothetical protein